MLNGKKNTFIIVFYSLVLLFFSTTSYAINFGLAVKASTAGVGADYIQQLNSYLETRIGGGYAEKNFKTKRGDNTFNVKAKMITGNLIVDFHPFANGFMLNAGAFYNGTKINAHIVSDYTVSLFGYEYTFKDVAEFEVDVIFDKKIAPYVGLGYNLLAPDDDGFGIIFDLGAINVGRVQVDLKGDCGDSITTEITCRLLKERIQKEEEKINKELDNPEYFWIPFINLSIFYKF
jgi:hypothetical protein